MACPICNDALSGGQYTNSCLSDIEQSATLCKYCAILLPICNEKALLPDEDISIRHFKNHDYSREIEGIGFESKWSHVTSLAKVNIVVRNLLGTLSVLRRLRSEILIWWNRYKRGGSQQGLHIWPCEYGIPSRCRLGERTDQAVQDLSRWMQLSKANSASGQGFGHPLSWIWKNSQWRLARIRRAVVWNSQWAIGLCGAISSLGWTSAPSSAMWQSFSIQG